MSRLREGDRVDMLRIFKTIGGLRISALVTRGPKTPVLLIHGNSASGAVFRHQVTELKRLGHATIAPDLPGHGCSENAEDAQSVYSFPGYADILRRLLRSLGISRYHIVGWSLGGHIGIELWQADAGVASLLVTGTPPVSLSPAGASQAFNITEIMDLAGTEDFGPRQVIAYGSAMIGRKLDGRSGLARSIARTDGKARHWMMKNGLTGFGIDQVLAVGQCKRPLAIVQGKSDPFVNIPYLRSLSYANLWLSEPIFMDCGHAPHLEKPELFNGYMGDFLQHVD